MSPDSLTSETPTPSVDADTQRVNLAIPADIDQAATPLAPDITTPSPQSQPSSSGTNEKTNAEDLIKFLDMLPSQAKVSLEYEMTRRGAGGLEFFSHKKLLRKKEAEYDEFNYRRLKKATIRRGRLIWDCEEKRNHWNEA